GTAGRRVSRVADQKLNGVHGNAQRFGSNDEDASTCSRAQVLGAQLDVDRSIGMDGEIAVAGMAASSPGMERQSDAAYYARAPRRDLPPRMPFLFPLHQLGGDGKLFAVSILALLGQVKVLAEEFHRIHVQLGRQVVQSAHRKDGGLRMVGCTPGARRAYVVADRDVFLPLVRNTEDVRNGRHAAASRTPGAPGVGLP